MQRFFTPLFSHHPTSVLLKTTVTQVCVNGSCDANTLMDEGGGGGTAITVTVNGRRLEDPVTRTHRSGHCLTIIILPLVMRNGSTLPLGP